MLMLWIANMVSTIMIMLIASYPFVHTMVSLMNVSILKTKIMIMSYYLSSICFWGFVAYCMIDAFLIVFVDIMEIMGKKKKIDKVFKKHKLLKKYVGMDTNNVYSPLWKFIVVLGMIYIPEAYKFDAKIGNALNTATLALVLFEILCMYNKKLNMVIFDKEYFLEIRR